MRDGLRSAGGAIASTAAMKRSHVCTVSMNSDVGAPVCNALPHLEMMGVPRRLLHKTVGLQPVSETPLFRRRPRALTERAATACRTLSAAGDGWSRGGLPALARRKRQTAELTRNGRGTRRHCDESDDFSSQKLHVLQDAAGGPVARCGSAPCRRPNASRGDSFIEYENLKVGPVQRLLWRQTGPRTYSAVTDAFISSAGGTLFPPAPRIFVTRFYVLYLWYCFVDDLCRSIDVKLVMRVPPQPAVDPGRATAAGQ